MAVVIERDEHGTRRHELRVPRLSSAAVPVRLDTPLAQIAGSVAAAFFPRRHIPFPRGMVALLPMAAGFGPL